MKGFFVLAAVIASLAGCAGSPALLDMSQDRVIVMGNNAGDAAVRAEAARGCGTYNRTPVFMSQACADDYCIQKRYLFACRLPGSNTSSIGGIAASTAG
jgi:hypothetical protein